MKINDRICGTTKIIGIIGDPIEHTISPQLQNTLCSEFGADFVFVPFKVERNRLEEAVKGLRALNVVGYNVTAPFKREIMKYIDDNARETFLMGAINVVKNFDGRLYGYNTDADGFSKAFKMESGTNFKGKKVVLIGAGGVARAIAVKMAKEGVEKISLVNRSISNASNISEVVNENIKEIVQIYNFNDKTLKYAFHESDIIINATSVGINLEDEETLISDTEYFLEKHIVYDLIYNPIKTKFLKDAEKKGCKIINGFGMLFYQGIDSFEIWTKMKLNEAQISNVYNSFKQYYLERGGK